ncbi:hypothetical protein [Paracoccus sp. (in: a-proteobacteria)]|uniref:hypothetical protein n=1 Tax=Paracoccus sp. TaxID=267 RepID=UPI00391CE092
MSQLHGSGTCSFAQSPVRASVMVAGITMQAPTAMAQGRAPAVVNTQFGGSQECA